MPEVLNKHKLLITFGQTVPLGAVYVGRGSKWGNPFRIGVDGDRVSVLKKHEEWLRRQPKLIAALDELRGEDLVCFCAPRACHGDLLLWLANTTVAQREQWQSGLIVRFR